MKFNHHNPVVVWVAGVPIKGNVLHRCEDAQLVRRAGLWISGPLCTGAFTQGGLCTWWANGGMSPAFFFFFNNVRAKLWSVFTHILSYYIYTYIISSDLTNATCIIVISPTYMCRWNPSIPRWLKHTSGAYPRSLQHPELRKDSELINHLQGAVVYARCWLLLECSSKNANSPMFWPK